MPEITYNFKMIILRKNMTPILGNLKTICSILMISLHNYRNELKFHFLCHVIFGYHFCLSIFGFKIICISG